MKFNRKYTTFLFVFVLGLLCVLGVNTKNAFAMTSDEAAKTIIDSNFTNVNITGLAPNTSIIIPLKESIHADSIVYYAKNGNYTFGAGAGTSFTITNNTSFTLDPSSSLDINKLIFSANSSGSIVLNNLTMSLNGVPVDFKSKVVTPVIAPAPTPPTPPAVWDGSQNPLEFIVSVMTNVFKDIKSAGMTIVISAIGLGTVFLGAKFLWGKVRQWLAKA